MLFENNKFKISLWDITKSCAVIFVCVFLWINTQKYFDRNNNNDKPGYDETTIEHIAENVIKVHLSENNKELKGLIKELEKNNSIAIKQAKLNNEKILEVAKIVGSLQSHTNSDPRVGTVYVDPKDNKKDLYDFIVESSASNGESFPVARVFFSPNASEDNKFSSQSFPLDVGVNIVESESDKGQERYVEMWIENNFVSSTKGKKFPINVKTVNWAKGELQEKKFRWGPRIGFSGIIDTVDIFPAIDVSLFSYGRTKRDIDWRFFGMAAGGSKDIFFISMYPFSYNVGNFLPLVENLFVGPTFSINSNSEKSYGIGISVPF